MNIDTFLQIGKQHKICEDYIIKGYDPVPFIILADGCSSSKDTEMGSRILCYLAKQYIRYHSATSSYNYDIMGKWIIHNAEMTARQLGLKRECLDATLIIGYVLNDTVYVFIYGDGSLILESNEGDIEIYQVKFSNNAPYYLSYLLDQSRHNEYHNMKNDKQVIMYNSKWHITDIATLAYDTQYIREIPFAKFPKILICSDGIDSFIVDDPTQQNPLHNTSEIVPGFLSFKTTKGDFLKRRLQKEIKTLEKTGITHYDDLAVGAFLSEG